MTANRRTLMQSLGAALAASALPRAARAQATGDVYVRGGGAFRPIVVSVSPLAGDTAGPNSITMVLTNDLSRSVFVQPVPGKPGQPDFAALKGSGAQFALAGAVTPAGGKLGAEFRLFDVNSGQQVAGQRYDTEASNARRVAHLLGDAVFTAVTGEKGFLDSRVVFVDETGPATKRVKRLAIMDQDGANVRYLTKGDELVVTPNFSQDAQEVTFMAYAGQKPAVYVLDVETGRREEVGNFPQMTFAPRFSPGGRKIAMSISAGETSSLFLMDLATRATTRLTNEQAIDTAPSFSPDGSKIVFESDRGGTQQLYVMSAAGGGATRITFGAGRYSTPAWSPKGDLIAFTRQGANGFGIGVMKPDGSGERILTEGFHNEGPTFAPNGLFVMYFSDPGGGGGAKIFMSDVLGRSRFAVPTPHYASDPSWGPLRK
ncbi:MAG: Tol-Pal system protein TolB [Hyphomicrobiales bacterium]|nr:Tol-Pal system protein TolB [Hyphomicrobiales bacterium]